MKCNILFSSVMWLSDVQQKASRLLILTVLHMFACIQGGRRRWRQSGRRQQPTRYHFYRLQDLPEHYRQWQGRKLHLSMCRKSHPMKTGSVTSLWPTAVATLQGLLSSYYGLQQGQRVHLCWQYCLCNGNMGSVLWICKFMSSFWAWEAVK